MQFREEPWPPSSLSEWASPISSRFWSMMPRSALVAQVNNFMRQQMLAQHYANAALAQNNINAQRVDWSYPREATNADLGIIDQNLDDKIGMEP